MKIVFQEAGGNHYAVRPQCERRGDKRVLGFRAAGCTGYLLFRAPLDKTIDLGSEAIQHAIAMLEEKVCTSYDVKLPQMEHITMRYISQAEFYKCSNGIEIPETAANYAVCGVWQVGNEFRVLWPRETAGSTTSVSVELSYSLRPYIITQRKFFRTVQEQTDFYQVTFDRKPGYSNGMVFYTIGDSGVQYPVMEQMLGKSTLIKTFKKVPVFHTAVPGVVLKKK